MTAAHPAIRRGRSLAAALVLCLAFAATAPAVTPPAQHGSGGAVASADPLATHAGLEMLAAGGNAVDAAVATALALAVVFPEAGNLGGGGFAVVRMGDEVASLDFRETAPGAAHRNMYLDADGEPISQASLVGPLAAGVPGSPAGLHELHRRFGALPWKAVVEPARRLAAGGFPVGPYLHAALADEKPLLSRFPETARVWLPGGEPPAVGSTVRLPDLAATLARYAAEGPTAITTGALAREVEAVSRRHGGVLTAADLAAYRPVWREPLTFSAFGWHLASMSLPSSGGLIAAATSGLLERLGWPELPRFGAERAHLLVEAWRRVYADRYLLGDPETTLLTPAAMLDTERLDNLAAGIDRQRATPSSELAPAPPARAEPIDTTHLSAVDGAGNLVALTTTVNDLFGCRLWAPGLGFLNNEMDDFAAAPGRPNLFGLVQGEANAVRPGRRMLSSMTPTLAWRGGEALALGGRGGSKIPTNTYQVLLNVLVDGDGLQEALSRPRLHHQWLPDRLEAEPDALAPETRAELERRGHAIEVTSAMGKVQAVRRLADGTFEAGGEPRGSSSPGVLAPLPGAFTPVAAAERPPAPR